jgi:hypothetical protein
MKKKTTRTTRTTKMQGIGILVAAGAVHACTSTRPPAPTSVASGPRRYQEDLDLLKAHVHVQELTDATGRARVAVVPAYQGRVMTSTTGGPRGESLGWVNADLVASGRKLAHMNPYGGEDRFWLGPEGGPFALFFPAGVPFDFEHWQTPPLIDTEPFERAGGDASEAVFRRRASLTNRAGFTFHLVIDRTVRLLDEGVVEDLVGVDLPKAASVVAFESENRVTNVGDQPWRKETGLPSIWILGMFPPSPGATIVIPFEPGPEGEKGPVVNDAYFGKVPADRLVVGKDVLFFRGDGRVRGKIGIPPRRARPLCGSYDPERHLLTLVQLTFESPSDEYVNSMWENQAHPFAGDVVNAYNDGPPAPGEKPLGPFYELESSSPALALAPGESAVHVHRTIHVQGDAATLEPIARHALGVGIAEITDAFGDGAEGGGRP